MRALFTERTALAMYNDVPATAWLDSVPRDRNRSCISCRKVPAASTAVLTSHEPYQNIFTLIFLENLQNMLRDSSPMVVCQGESSQRFMMIGPSVAFCRVQCPRAPCGLYARMQNEPHGVEGGNRASDGVCNKRGISEVHQHQAM